MNKRTVIVTGASSGSGRATARRLLKAGFEVYGGVRKQADADELQSEGIIPLLVDVADTASIEAAGVTMSEKLGDRGLYALVNNAGIGSSAPLEFQPQRELRGVFEVNVFGLMAMTQTMLPLIRKAGGRVVNIGSIGDRFTLPFGGALCASKSAVRSFTEALRLELHPFGIHVVLIQPASISTPAVTKFNDEAAARFASMPAEAEEQYGDLYRNFVRRASVAEKAGSPPTVVADAVCAALTDRTPKARYLVGKGNVLLSVLPAVLPDRVLDAAKFLLLGLPLAFGARAAYVALKERDEKRKQPAAH